jgi:hypothetical protein
MAREKPIEIFTPPNALKAKIGGPLPALDQRAIQRAEQALAKLSDQFGDWIKEELDRLLEAWGEYETLGSNPHTKSELHRRAHDLKGLAPTLIIVSPSSSTIAHAPPATTSSTRALVMTPAMPLAEASTRAPTIT